MPSKILKVEPSAFNKTLDVPSSKSFANRALILAAIDERDIVIHNMPESSDVEVMIECLRRIGVKILRDNETITVKGSFPKCEISTQSIITLRTGDGGTTNRFLIPLLALGKNQYIIEPKGHMKERPMEELFVALKKMGVHLESGHGEWLKIKGPINTNIKEIEIDCERTTQFATGLQLVFSNKDIKVIPKKLSSSKSYFDLTLKMIDDFKIASEFEVPVDFSSLSYPVALALLSGKVTVKNCHKIDELQADSKLLKFINMMGATYQLDQNGLVVSKQKLEAASFDCTDCPDLIPTLAFICSYAKGTSSIKGVNLLKFKESNRLKEIIRLFKEFSIDYTLHEEETGELLIQGVENTSLERRVLSPPDDHRMVMASYLYLRMNGGGELTNPNSVKKSFPDFFDVME